MRQLRVIKLVNFQSWSDKSDDMTFAPDVLNVIKGRNETGKSVVFKVLYEMCFPGYHGAQYLIRRGYAEGFALFVYTDGLQVLFQLALNGTRTYHLQMPDSENIQSWRQSEIPDEIVSAMGLLISRENQIILNVLDKDVPLPFIKSDPKYNASVLKSKLEPEELTRFFERSKDYVRRIQGARAHFSHEADVMEARQSSLQYVDIDSMKATRIFLDNHAAALNPYIELFNSLVDYDQLLGSAPEVKLYSLDEAKELLDTVELLEDVKHSMMGYQQLLDECPPQPRYSQECLSEVYTSLNALRDALECKQGILDFSQLQKPEVNQVQSVAPELEVYQSLELISSRLDAITSLKQPDSVDIPADVPNMLEMYQVSRQAFSHLGSVYQNAVGVITSSDTLSRVTNDISRMENEMGICPTCGRPFHEQGCNHT